MALNAQIQNQKSQLDDREKRQESLAILGGMHMAIQNRIKEIKQITPEFGGYAEKYESCFSRKILDQDSQSGLDEIETFLETEVKGASLAIYTDQTNFKFIQQPIGGGLELLQAKFTYKQWALQFLNHRANQLMKVIEICSINKGENK
jgi:hypothetical protein